MVQDITFRILILVLIVFGLKTKIALWKLLLSMVIFKKKFIECPPGMADAEEDNVLPLNKCIHGLVQAARQYHEMAAEVLHKMDSMLDKLNMSVLETI